MKTQKLKFISVLLLSFLGTFIIVSMIFNAWQKRYDAIERAREDAYYFDGLTLSKAQIRNHWLTNLSEKNPYLYMEVIKAFIVSKKEGKTVYVLRGKDKGVPPYYISLETGNGSDVISIDHVSREVRFDHFNDADGPSVLDSAQKIWIEMKVKEINKEVDIGAFIP